MGSIHDRFPSGQYLKAADVEEDLKLTITRVDDVLLDESDKHTKPVVEFGSGEKLVLNRTNAVAIAESYGEDDAAWAGKPVVLYRTSTMFQGRQVPCIRVKVPPEAARHDDPF